MWVEIAWKRVGLSIGLTDTTDPPRMRIGCFKARLVCSLVCCFLREETLHHVVSLHPGIQMATGDMLRVNPTKD